MKPRGFIGGKNSRPSGLGLFSSEVAEKPAAPEALLRVVGIVAAPCQAQDGASSGAKSAEVRVSSNACCQRISADRHMFGSLQRSGWDPDGRLRVASSLDSWPVTETPPKVGAGARSQLLPAAMWRSAEIL